MLEITFARFSKLNMYLTILVYLMIGLRAVVADLVEDALAADEHEDVGLVVDVIPAGPAAVASLKSAVGER